MSEYLRLDPKPGDLAMVRRIKAERVIVVKISDELWYVWWKTKRTR